MKNSFKRMLSLAITLFMLIGMLPGQVFATTAETESAKRVNLVLVDGQSNAAGTAGEMRGASVVMPAEGEAYIWNGEEAVDLNTYVSAKVAANANRSVGFHPALAKALNEATGLPTVIIHEGHSGESIVEWTSRNTATGVAAINACKAWLAENGFEIANSGYVWLQGESDACPDFVASYCNYATLEEYYNAYLGVHNAYINALGNGAVGGIVTVQTRQQLLTNVGKASEYCGVRAAQQALANQIAGLVIVSDITDGWRKSSDSEKFSVSGGPIHYSQAGYNLIGLDAGANLAKVWAGNAAVTGFQLVGHDGTTVYANGAEIKVNDNLLYEGTQNEREHGAAQIVVKTLPVYADCAGVTMTAAGDVITSNGFIADAAALKGDVALTVTAAGYTQNYTLVGAQAATSTNPGVNAQYDYLWDFTDSSKVNGAVLTATKGGNDLTYIKDIAVTENGMNNNSYGRGYFLMDEAIVLAANEPWTIEWQGSMPVAATPVAGTAGGTLSQANALVYVSTDTDGGNAMWFKGNGNSNKAILKGYANEVKNDSNSKWYVIHDGNGNLTMACANADGVVYLKGTTNGAIKQDYTFDTVLGYFLASSTAFNYSGIIKYLAIYNEAYELPVENVKISGVQNVNITAPATGIASVNTVSGTNYTGTVTWSPADSVFAGETVYTAAVVLTAADGYAFAADAAASVAGAAVANVAVAADGKTLSFTAQFPATAAAEQFNAPTTDDFYWDFTTAVVSGKEVSSVSGNGWTENKVIYTGSSAVNQNETTGIGTTAGQFFQLQTPALLPKDSAWTIEWSGMMSKASIVFADNNNETGVLPTSRSHMHMWFDGTGMMNMRDNSGTTPLTLNAANYAGKDATWYVSHDGNGTLTLAVCYNGEWLTAAKANGVTADMTLDSLMGVFSSAIPFCYQGSMKSFKIYHEALVVDPEVLTAANVEITAPKTNAQPQTAVTGANFSGTIAWDLNASAFASGTVYTATVTLTAAAGYVFDANSVFTVPGATVGAAVLSKNGATAAFEAQFPATQIIDTTSDFYWDFTNPSNQSGNTTVYSESDDKWTSNTLTYIDHSQKGNNLKLKPTGFSNNGGGYFEMEKAVYLPLNEPWTIEWKGNTMWSSVLMANNDSTSVDAQGHKTTEYIYIYNNDKANTPEANYITIANSGTAGNNQKAAGFGPIPTSARENPDSVWYLKNTNEGDLFLEYRSGNSTEKVYINANTDIGRKNYTFDSLLGYFTEKAPIYYASTIQYIKIYRDEVVNQSELNLAVPAFVPATTSFNTAMFTASINWEDMATMAVSEMVNRMATLTLKAAPGYRFSDLANFVVPGAVETEVLSISEDGSTAEVMAVFQVKKVVEQDMYHWDLTDPSLVNGATIAAVEGGNNLTYTGGNITANAEGLGDNPLGSYYKMDTAITLHKDQPWTIEWSGAMKSASLVFSNNGNAAPASASHEHFWYDGIGVMHLRGNGGTDLGGLTLNAKEFSGKEATWYVTHDGNGTLTFAVTDGTKTLVASKENAINADYTVDSLMGVYMASNPFSYQGSMKYMKIYRSEAVIAVAKIGSTFYTSLADAIAAVETGAYSATPAAATTITLLADVESGFDIGIETGSLSTFKTQNVILDLNGYTLTLGHPPVGSSAILKTIGLRVLAFSKLEIKNGKVAVDNDIIRIAMANYGTLTLTDVEVTADTGVTYTINNRGDLTLAGATSVANGTEAAITNQPYNYPDAQNINAKLNVASADVVVGDVQVELSNVQQGQTGAVNAGVPEINISAGTFGKIYDDGETAKTPVGNISGGTFAAAVPEELCEEGYIPTANNDGTYGVKKAEKEVEVKHNLTLESQIDFSFFVPKSELAASGLTATIVHDRADGYNDKTVTLAQTEWETAVVGGVEYWRIRYTDVAAKEMVDTLTLTITDGVNTVATDSYSVATYAKERIANSSDANMKALMTAMLHYGAAAQKYFDYKADTLANAGVAATENVSANSAAFTSTIVKHNLTLESEINFSFFIPKSELAASGLTAQIVQDRTGNNADKSITLAQAEWETAVVGGVEYWRIRYDFVAPKEISDKLTLTITNGTETVVTDVYSVEQFAQERIQNSSNESMKALMQALLNYGAAAKTYFSY